jgi:hypothetical protein
VVSVSSPRRTACGRARTATGVPTCPDGPTQAYLRRKEGLQALSLNIASRIRHLPVWFTLRHDPPWLRYLHERGLANPALLGSPSLRPQEIKPNLGMIMNDLSILLATARHLDEPLYVFGDDAKDYFNQLAIASEDWWKLGIVFLHADEIHNPRQVGERLFFVSGRFRCEGELGPALEQPHRHRACG